MIELSMYDATKQTLAVRKQQESLAICFERFTVSARRYMCLRCKS